MKNIITRVLGCVCGMVLSTALAAQTATAPLELASDAPDRYVVVRGDTLWGISARFLRTPWRWPEIWQLNREEIDNPHLIYPGDVVYLDRSGDRPRLRIGRPGELVAAGTAPAEPSLRLQPSVRATPAGETAIPTMDLSAIRVFMNRPLIVDEKGLAAHPRVVATQDGRVYLSRGDLAYVRGLRQEDSAADWHVYRPARPLVDPDTRKPIAYEALYVGGAKLVRGGDPATFMIQSTNEEIGEGDRLMPAEHNVTPTLAPRPPASAVSGRIVSVYRGLDQVGRNSVVAVNLGQRNGIDVGHVLAVQSTGRQVVDRQTKEKIRLPNENIGQLLVFRVFDAVAYGLVVDAREAIAVGATVTNP
jgi:hypothetical protein